MTLRAVKGGWINTDFEQEYEATYHTDRTMITQERKSKYKHKITVPKASINREEEMREWCEQSYGPGGRKQRWRFGWIQEDSTFYFRSSKDAMMFTLRWS
jgi:hypothetical protein